MLEPRLEKIPTLKICIKSGAKSIESKIICIVSKKPAFFTPKTTTKSPKLKNTTEKGVSFN